MDRTEARVPRKDVATAHDEAAVVVSIVVLNHNGRPWLERCLGAAVAELAPDCELIVVDNGSGDGSVDFVTRAFPAIRRVVLDQNLGFAAGNNIGAKAARGRYVAFLNNDAAPRPGWLAALRNALDRDDTLGLASSLIVFMHDPSIVDSAGDGLTRWGGAFKHAHGCTIGEASGAADVFGACGAAFLVRRDLFEQAGGFDTAFFAVYRGRQSSSPAPAQRIPMPIRAGGGRPSCGERHARSAERSGRCSGASGTWSGCISRTLPGHCCCSRFQAMSSTTWPRRCTSQEWGCFVRSHEREMGGIVRSCLACGDNGVKSNARGGSHGFACGD